MMLDIDRLFVRSDRIESLLSPHIKETIEIKHVSLVIFDVVIPSWPKCSDLSREYCTVP